METATQEKSTQENIAVKTNDNEKLIAALCHGLGAVVIPLLVYILKKDDSPYLARHSKSALVWQAAASIVLTLASMVISALASFTFGLGALFFLLLPPAGLVAFCVGLYAAVKCWKGEEYQYPFIQPLLDSF